MGDHADPAVARPIEDVTIAAMLASIPQNLAWALLGAMVLANEMRVRGGQSYDKREVVNAAATFVLNTVREFCRIIGSEEGDDYLLLDRLREFPVTEDGRSILDLPDEEVIEQLSNILMQRDDA